tara:strand:+ start:658 stop:870 length:213 start_codon:yes stop_codon:yes gene_type:complete
LINCSHKQPEPSKSLIKFLKIKLGLSDNDINLGLKQCEIEQAPLPIVLWSFGLLNLEQYQRVLDWQKKHQ